MPGVDRSEYMRVWAASNPPCTVPGCDSLVWARGWCKAHYSKWWRRNSPAAKCVKFGCERIRKHSTGLCDWHTRRLPQPAWSTADRVLDLLQVDGEWWTVRGLMDRFGLVSEDALFRVLRNLRNRGLVVSRVVELAKVGGEGVGRSSLDVRSD